MCIRGTLNITKNIKECNFTYIFTAMTSITKHITADHRMGYVPSPVAAQL